MGAAEPGDFDGRHGVDVVLRKSDSVQCRTMNVGPVPVKAGLGRRHRACGVRVNEAGSRPDSLVEVDEGGYIGSRMPGAPCGR